MDLFFLPFIPGSPSLSNEGSFLCGVSVGLNRLSIAAGRDRPTPLKHRLGAVALSPPLC